MGDNPVITMLGRRLRLAVIGGGPGSFIGRCIGLPHVSMTVMSWSPLPCPQTRSVLDPQG